MKTGPILLNDILMTMRKKGVPLEVRERVVRDIRFPHSLRLLGTSIKVDKGEKKGVLTAVMYLAPHESSKPYGGKNVCPFATPGCIASCLGHSSGRLTLSTSQNAQIWKTLAFFYARSWFLDQLGKEIVMHSRKAIRKGLIPAIRLDGSSDLGLAEHFSYSFPHVQFYDYTKSYAAAVRFATDRLPPNVHVTFSLAETTESHNAAACLAKCKGNVAVVFRTKDPNAFPSTWRGLPVIDGDETDVRFMDPKGCCVGLTVKGNKAPKDRTGFVQEIK